MKAQDREEYETAWRMQFYGLAALTLQCKGVLHHQLHEEMRDCFETILNIAATQIYGDRPGSLIKREIRSELDQGDKPYE
jgi:hypothetical protein